jgi:hypothetical protein
MREPQFLDKELQKIIREADSGKQQVDMLVQVWLLDGTEEWILLHLEVQHRPQPGFGERLLWYRFRIADVYRRPVATLAVLADADPNWRPTFYESETLGSRIRLTFRCASC